MLIIVDKMCKIWEKLENKKENLKMKQKTLFVDF